MTSHCFCDMIRQRITCIDLYFKMSVNIEENNSQRDLKTRTYITWQFAMWYDKKINVSKRQGIIKSKSTLHYHIKSVPLLVNKYI